LYESVPPYEFFDLQQKADEIVPGLSPAKCALDTALIDWIGKSLNIPVYNFLGINPVESVPTSFSIGLDTPEIMQQKVREAEPYSILKIKLANRDDEEIINALRKVTDKPLRVDINEGWKNREEAIRKIEWLAGQGIELIEQPMPTEMVEETAWVRERSPIPIIADEAVHIAKDIPQLAGAYDGINIKLAKSGGLFEAYRMIILAQAMDMKIMIGCMIESSVAIGAAVQLQPLAHWLDLDGNMLVSNDPFHGPRFENGRWYVNDLPGIGVERKDR
jgi:L-alanine-DL-glutamate epimerase-like enolase superfamily enzyme